MHYHCKNDLKGYESTDLEVRCARVVAITDNIRGLDVGDGRVSVLGNLHDKNLPGPGACTVRAAHDGHGARHRLGEGSGLELDQGGDRCRKTQERSVDLRCLFYLKKRK